jgi:hypothetical protein
MADLEALTLDGLALNDTTNFIMESLTMPPPRQRPEWLTAADSEGGTLARNPLHENREIGIRVRVAQLATTDLALAKVATLVDKLQKASKTPDGVALTWTPAGGTLTRTFDVLSGEITGMPITWDGADAGWFYRMPVLDITLTAKPYWRGSEVTTSTASTTTPFVTLEVANVPGDIPALGRLIVTDSATQNRRHVEWGLENQNYNSGTSLLVDSDNMTTSGFSGVQNTGPATPYDPNATGNNVVTITPTPSPQAMCSTGNLTHIGVFRVKARVFVPTVDTNVRIGYRVGDGPLVYNAWAAPYAGAQWAELDLGVITIPAVTSGTQRWVGQIEAFATTTAPVGTPFVYLDYLILVPAGEGYGVARNPVVFESVLSFNARDEFDQSAGALTAKTLPVGGTWAGAGDADDFSVNATAHTATRTAVSDTDAQTGRYGIAGSTNYTNVLVQADISRTELGGTPTAGKFIYQGVLARYVDTSNWLMAVAATEQIANPGAYSIRVIQRLAGVFSYLQIVPVQAPPSSIRLVVDTAGKWFVWAFPAGTEPSEPIAFGSHTQLATGGTLATGKPGIYDTNTTTFSVTRTFDNFFASAQAVNAALYSTRTLEVRHNDTIRADSTGTYFGRPTSYRGTRFLVPPGTSRVLAKARRNDVTQFADENVTDNTQIQVAYTPRGIAVPR